MEEDDAEDKEPNLPAQASSPKNVAHDEDVKEEKKDALRERGKETLEKPVRGVRNIGKHCDPKVTAVERRKNKAIFNNMLGYLQKAKTRLEKEKPDLDRQSQLQKRKQNEQEINSQDLIEKKVGLSLTPLVRGIYKEERREDKREAWVGQEDIQTQRGDLCTLLAI